MSAAATATPVTKRAFITYTHDSDDHRGRVLALADALMDHGIQCILDQYEPALKNGDGAGWMEKQIREADSVLVICTSEYCGAWEDSLPADKRKGARWEILHVRNAVYLAGSKNEKFIPVLFDHADEQYIPLMLGTCSRYVVCDQPGYESLYWRITGQQSTTAPPLGTIATRAIVPRPIAFKKPGTTAGASSTKARAAPDTALTLKLNQNFDTFNDAAQAKVVDAVKRLLATGAEVRVKQKRRGCVELDIEVVGDIAARERLTQAIAAGALAEFGLMTARVNELAVVVPSPATERHDTGAITDLAVATQSRRLKVFVSAANPERADFAKLREEIAAIRGEQRIDEAAPLLVLSTNYDSTLESWSRLLSREMPVVIHFSGHGDAEHADDLRTQVRSAGSFVTEHLEFGWPDGSHRPRLCVLHACEASPESEASLLRQIPVMIQVPREMPLGAQHRFTGNLYRALSAGRSIQSAFDQAMALLHALDAPVAQSPMLIAMNSDIASWPILSEDEVIRVDSNKAAMAAVLSEGADPNPPETTRLQPSVAGEALGASGVSTEQSEPAPQRAAVESLREFLEGNYTAIIKSLHTFYRARMGPAHDAEDLVQETLCRVWINADKVRADSGSGRTWWPYIMAVARNAAIDNARAKRRLREVESEDAGFASVLRERLENPSPSEGPMWDASLQEAMASLLSTPDRELLYLWLTGYSTDQVASAMNISRLTVYTRWAKIRAKLREQMKVKPTEQPAD